MRRTSFHRIVLSIFLFLFVNSSSFSQNGTITGSVKYGKESLQAATVSAGKITVLTDQNGNFSLSIEPGTYTLVITYAGYKKIEQSVNVDAGSTKYFLFDVVL